MALAGQEVTRLAQPALTAGKHQVQDHQVWPFRAEGCLACRAIAGLADSQAFVLQVKAHHLGSLQFVFNQQNVQRCHTSK